MSVEGPVAVFFENRDKEGAHMKNEEMAEKLLKAGVKN